MSMVFREKHRGPCVFKAPTFHYLDKCYAACVLEDWPGRVIFFSPVALCQTRCELVGNVLWAKQFASSLENSLHLQVGAVNLARQNPGSFEALVFAKYLVISYPFATCSYPLLP